MKHTAFTSLVDEPSGSNVQAAHFNHYVPQSHYLV